MTLDRRLQGNWIGKQIKEEQVGIAMNGKFLRMLMIVALVRIPLYPPLP